MYKITCCPVAAYLRVEVDECGVQEQGKDGPRQVGEHQQTRQGLHPVESWDHKRQ